MSHLFQRFSLGHWLPKSKTWVTFQGTDVITTSVHSLSIYIDFIFSIPSLIEMCDARLKAITLLDTVAFYAKIKGPNKLGKCWTLYSFPNFLNKFIHWWHENPSQHPISTPANVSVVYFTKYIDLNNLIPLFGWWTFVKTNSNTASGNFIQIG